MVDLGGQSPSFCGEVLRSGNTRGLKEPLDRLGQGGGFVGIWGGG